MKCTKCNKDIENGIRFCPSCGTPCSTTALPNGGGGQQTSPAALVYPKNPPLSPHLCWVNLALGGLAQIIYGQGAKGLTILAIQIFSNLVLPIVLALLIGAVSIYDAYLVGKALKMGKTLTKWQWLPTIASPNGGGGQQTSPAALVHPKNPPLSPHLCWVNLALGGLAQIIYGQGAKGLTILAIQIFSNLVLPIVLALLIGAVSIYDAYLVGKALKMGKTLTKWQWFPS